MSDLVFRMPAIRLAEGQVRLGAPVWMYRFDWESPAFGGVLGAAHAMVIPFVFNTLDVELSHLYQRLARQAEAFRPDARIMDRFYPLCHSCHRQHGRPTIWTGAPP
jgi:carboxylesterase type B